MEIIHDNVYSRYNQQQSLDIFLNNYNSSRINLYDLDGTIHRGKNPNKYNGYSAVDLSKTLARKIMFKKPHLLFKYISACLDTKKLKTDLVKIGLCEKEMDGAITEIFFKGALQGLPYNLVKSSAKKLPYKAYNKSKETILELGKYAKATAIITKSFSICAEPYKDWFEANNLEVILDAFNFEIENGKIKDLVRHTSMDKTEQTHRVIGNSTHQYNEALVFGDHDRDLEMVKALKQLNLDYKIIAVNPFPNESGALLEKADFIINGWKGLHSFLNF